MTPFLSSIFQEWPAGKTLANPKKWKSLQFLSSKILILLSLGTAVYRVFVGELPISDEDLVALSGSVASVCWTINSIITKITTDKI